MPETARPNPSNAPEMFTDKEVSEAIKGGALNVDGEIKDITGIWPASVDEYWDKFLEAGLSYLDKNPDKNDVAIPPQETDKLARLIYQEVSGEKDSAVPYAYKDEFKEIAGKLSDRINEAVAPHFGVVHSAEKSAVEKSAAEGRADEFSQKAYVAERTNVLVEEMKKEFDEAVAGAKQEIKDMLNIK